jgi:hypothetical protein
MRIGYRHPLYGARQNWPPLDSPKACPPPQAPAPRPPAERGENIDVKLLAAFREIFAARKANQISTIAVLKALIERQGEPWAALLERDITSGNVRAAGAQLARLLKPFGIAAHTIREPDGSTPKGYKLQHFEAAFSRYLPPKPPFNATTPQAHE